MTSRRSSTVPSQFRDYALERALKRRGAVAVHALAILITVFAGLLRLDAYVQKYGVLDRPGWARVLTQEIAPLAGSMRPASFSWKREARPYVGGDPINYIRFAREMTSFYQAHVREPVFLALTRAWLWALDGQDAAVSFASLTGSTLTVFAAYLLGSVVWSRSAGLFAALFTAVEYEMITWAPDGWRDDTFTATVLFAAWGLIRLRQQPSRANAVLAGALCGLSCLARLSALTFVLPALAWLALDGDAPPRRERLKSAATALAACAIVIAPYLVSCALVLGDPLFAVNYHTIYYRSAEHMPIDRPMTAAEYLRVKVAARPIATLDTALNGLFVEPFVTKWNGFGRWFEGLGPVLQWLSLAGAGALACIPRGRLLLVILVTSVAPFMLTWNIGGGGEWRFTMHAYPFYVVAASIALAGGVRLVRVPAPGAERRAAAARLARRAGAIVAAAALGAILYVGLPWFVVREAIAAGDSTSVETGRRDLVFYRSGWSAPHAEGVTVRVSRGERSTVHLPLAGRRDYDIVLRLDPADPSAQDRASVLLNGHLVGLLRLTWDPGRVGAYRVRVKAHMVRSDNQLTIIPSTLVTAGAAGPRFAWLDAGGRIGVRLWYVRVLPLP